MMKKIALILAFSFVLPACLLFAGDVSAFIELQTTDKIASTLPDGARVKVTLLTKELPAWLTPETAYVMVPAALKSIMDITVADADNSVTVRAAVEASVIVLSAAKNVIQGQVLKAEDLAYSNADLINAKGLSYFTGTGEGLVGLRAARPLKAGTLIASSDLEKQPDVTTGMEVTIKCEINGISVSDVGRAEEPGFTGALIKVRNLKSKKLVMAKVVSSKMVEVEAR